ncbi:MAG: hypothetical protein A3E30_18620 [Fluviicola sp. RIFCSPHIGHO2_12_FULL_43_24]|nr:MAG: hypothetical protein A3E30_18620 [Fluviicola sp. RIFCSPHIGHO2_12_FULL_43_24]
MPAKLLFFLFLNSFNAFILLVGVSYLYPDFSSGYLQGKEALFDSYWFPAGLAIHAASAPLALLLVSLLVIFRVERNPKIHRLLGKITLIVLLLFVVPSGWILSYYAMGGVLGKLIFFLLAGYTAFAALQGYFAIRKQDITTHKHWMREVLVLLASAILLRLLLVLFYEFDFVGNTAYNTAAVLSWIPSILILKLIRKTTIPK